MVKAVRWWRVGTRGVLVLVWSAWCVVWLVATRREAILGIWARRVCRILGVGILRSGPLPPPGSLIVANHLGYLDIVALAALVDTAFVAKQEVAGWPGIGRAASAAGAIFINRRRVRDLPRVMARMHDTLNRGRRVVLFPESTSTDGRRVLPFRSGLLQVANDRDLPVWVASMAFHCVDSDVDVSDHLCWHGDQALLPHVFGLLQVPTCTVRIAFHDHALYARHRKDLARLAHDTCEEGIETERRLPLGDEDEAPAEQDGRIGPPPSGIRLAGA